MLKILNIMVYVLKKKASQGSIEVCFTLGNKTTVSRGFTQTKAVIDYVDSHRPAANMDQSANVGSSLSHLLDKFIRSTDGLLSRLGRLAASTLKKKKMLFVLTDGIWQEQSTAERTIARVVQRLDDLSEPDDQLGVQFVQFGSDLAGIERLRFYDQNLDLSQ